MAYVKSCEKTDAVIVSNGKEILLTTDEPNEFDQDLLEKIWEDLE